MKTYVLSILMISSCIMSGCATKMTSLPSASSSPVAKYADPQISVRKKTTAELEWEAKQKRSEEDFFRAYAWADLVLKARDYQWFEETKPDDATATLETLRDSLHKNKKLPGYGVAFVVIEREGPPFMMGEKPPPSHRAELEQILKDAGFGQIYFCSERDLLSVQ